MEQGDAGQHSVENMGTRWQEMVHARGEASGRAKFSCTRHATEALLGEGGRMGRGWILHLALDSSFFTSRKLRSPDEVFHQPAGVSTQPAGLLVVK